MARNTRIQIYFKETIQMSKLRVESIMTHICLLWQWHPNTSSFQMLSFQNILPFYNNCHTLLAIL